LLYILRADKEVHFGCEKTKFDYRRNKVFVLTTLVSNFVENVLPGDIFINILCVPVAPVFLHQKIIKPNVTRDKLLNLLLYK